MQPEPVQPSRRRLGGSPCTCYVCGVDVYPQPLDIVPGLDLRRGYAVVAVLENKRTHELRLQARLFCPACADSAVISQNEQRVEIRDFSARPPTIDTLHTDFNTRF